MKLEVEIVSKEIIKPSSPTPNHLGGYQLSFLDQITPPVYNSMVLFYLRDSDNKSNNSDKSNRLKQSLSEVLTRFYPLAGRVKGNLFVDCNDEGIPYLEAQVKCQLSSFLENPVPGELNKLVPFELHGAEELVLGIQFNIFECGGIGIGMCIAHKIGDALSFFTFVKSWAATTRGERDFVCPEFDSSTLFPPVDIFKPSTSMTEENVVTKRFVFSASTIMAIRAKYADIQNLKRPSRVEALSAFIWNRFVAASLIESESEKIYMMIHLVNLRTRIDPPLPENSFGNYYWHTVTIPASKQEEDADASLKTNKLVSLMRDALSKIDKDCVKNLQEGFRELGEQFTRGEIIPFTFTSLCRFPIYEADFGWENPVWVGPPARAFKNVVAFFDTKSGDGIEAYLSLKEDYMAKLEGDKEFLKYVAPTGC